jgi:hypothetical protein
MQRIQNRRMVLLMDYHGKCSFANRMNQIHLSSLHVCVSVKTVVGNVVQIVILHGSDRSRSGHVLASCGERAPPRFPASLGKYHCKHSESASKTRRTQNIHTMSTRVLSLPIRALSRPQIVQHAERYTCRRCLHGPQAQAQEATSAQIDAPAHLRPAPLDLLKRILPHSIRPQLLQHVDPERLNGREKEAALNARKHADIVGVVVRTGRMDQTVSVRVPKQRWEPRIKKV